MVLEFWRTERNTRPLWYLEVWSIRTPDGAFDTEAQGLRAGPRAVTVEGSANAFMQSGGQGLTEIGACQQGVMGGCTGWMSIPSVSLCETDVQKQSERTFFFF